MNKHLSLEDITEFLAINKLDEEAMTLSKRVYKHAAICKECRTAIEVAQRFFDTTGKRMTAGQTLIDIEEISGERVYAQAPVTEVAE